jgi:hypothetical protein
MKLMTLKTSAVSLLVTLSVVFSPPAFAQAADIETTKATAEEAYTYGFPLVMNYKVFHDSFLDPKAKGYKGPLNQIHNEAQVYTPANRVVQTPNSDTPYSMLGADLRAEPLVICVPEVGEGRYSACKWWICSPITTATLARARPVMTADASSWPAQAGTVKSRLA